MSNFFKGETNQPFFKSMRIGLFGPGQLVGETDVLANRPYNYTLKTLGPNAKYYLVPAD